MPYRIIGRGPLAQLVERHVYTVDVIGSSPVGPTLEQYGIEMSNDGTNWHSDDELASALERALEIPTDAAGDAGAAYTQQDSPAATASNDFSDLFAALVETEAPDPTPSPAEAAAAVVETNPVEADAVETEVVETTDGQGYELSAEQVFESLDDFKPRTNFIPIVGSDTIDQPAAEVEAEPQAINFAAQDVPTHAVTLSSAQVTQPVRYDRQRLTFDEIVFGVTSAPESN